MLTNLLQLLNSITEHSEVIRVRLISSDLGVRVVEPLKSIVRSHTTCLADKRIALKILRRINRADDNDLNSYQRTLPPLNTIAHLQAKHSYQRIDNSSSLNHSSFASSVNTLSHVKGILKNSRNRVRFSTLAE